jgi:hypothetical protein
VSYPFKSFEDILAVYKNNTQSKLQNKQWSLTILTIVSSGNELPTDFAMTLAAGQVNQVQLGLTHMLVT